MDYKNSKLVGNTLNLGYRFQRYWDNSMAAAFFCGELGAGIFFVSMLYGFVPGMVIGLIFTGAGKPYFHLTHMGVPSRSWRAMIRPDRSWISRGLISIGVFTGAGILHVLNVVFNLPMALGFSESAASVIAVLIQTVAIIGAFVVMVYQGFAMSHSKAIALWDSQLLPISGMLYALTGGVLVTLALGWFGFVGQQPEVLSQLVNAGLALLIINFVVVLAVIFTANNRSKGGELSVELLMKTAYKGWFQGVVLAVGFAVPVLALLFVSGFIGLLIAAVAALGGFFAYRVLVFKAGVYEPIDLATSLGVV